MTVYGRRPIARLPENSFYYLIAASLAILSPYLTVSENYAVLFLFIGAVVGVFLFSYPVYCFWLLFYSAFLMGIIVSFFPKIATLRWGIILLALLLGFRALIEFADSGKSRMGFKLDKGLLIVTCFIVIATVSSIINGIAVGNIVVSMKGYFKFIPMLFTLAILPQFKNKSMIRNIFAGLLIIALIQVPVALYQRFIQGAHFLAMGYKDITVGDAVCGTFANSLFGGASKTLSLYLIFCSSLLMSFAKYQIISQRKAAVISMFLLVPILFNETKISFIYIPILFLFFSMKSMSENKIKSIGIILVGLILILGIGYAYKKIYTHSESDYDRYVNSSWDYNFGQVGYAHYKLNRLTVLTFWSEQQKRYGLIPFFIGHGLNAANEGNAGVYGERGRMAAEYPSYGIGLTMVSRLLWETGVLGAACFFTIIFYSFRRAASFLKEESSDVFHSAMLFGLQAGLILYAIALFADSSFISIEVSNFFFSFIVGLTLMMTQRKEK